MQLLVLATLHSEWLQIWPINKVSTNLFYNEFLIIFFIQKRFLANYEEAVLQNPTGNLVFGRICPRQRLFLPLDFLLNHTRVNAGH